MVHTWRQCKIVVHKHLKTWMNGVQSNFDMKVVERQIQQHQDMSNKYKINLNDRVCILRPPGKLRMWSWDFFK